MNYDAPLLYLYVHSYVVNTCSSQMRMRDQGRICYSTKMTVWRKVATTAKYRGKMPIFILVGEGTVCKPMDV